MIDLMQTVCARGSVKIGRVRIRILYGIYKNKNSLRNI